METRTERYEADTLTEGLDVYGSEISPRLHFSEEVYNISNQRGQGAGPRYGFAPIPYQHINERIGSSHGGCRFSENTGSAGYTQLYGRKKCYGIIPIRFGQYSDLSSPKTHFVYLFGIEYGGLFVVQACMTKEPNGSGWTSDIAGGFSFVFARGGGAGYYAPTFLRARDFIPILSLVVDSSINNLNYSQFQKRSKSISQPWWIGHVDPSYPDTATRMGLPMLNHKNNGTCPSFTSGTFDKNTRRVSFYSIGGTIGGVPRSDSMANKWEYSLDLNTYQYTFKDYYTDETELPATWPTTTAIAREDSAAVVVGTTEKTLMYEPMLKISSGFQLICLAIGKAVGFMYQEFNYELSNDPAQFFDFSNILPFSDQEYTYAQGGGTYTEFNKEKDTCFYRWPATTYAVTATPTLAAIEAGNLRNGQYHVALGAANSGILRLNSIYEFTYSYYDYTTDHECNVGVPAIIIPTADYQSLFVYLSPTTTGGTPGAANPYLQDCGHRYWTYLPFRGIGITPKFMLVRYNHMEIRLYYRERGTFEWLPAGRKSATELFWNPDLPHWEVCTGTEFGLPGGQPGAFNDYSHLPQDNWTDVASFNRRVFWQSDNQLVFSRKDDPFAYPARNSISCPSGTFRGMKVHVFKGQSEQTGRIIFFGSEAYYYGEFTGVLINEPVRISLDTVQPYPVDGSDFDVRLRATVTSFSGRSAVVAEGILFFWGPQGIYADDGVDMPQKISAELEPDFFSWYNKSEVSDIQSVYNAQTKEVIWFFTPDASIGTEPTHALVYSMRVGKWLYHKFDAKIDWAQPLDISDTVTARGVDGSRIVVGMRESSIDTISRPYFFDHFCNSGDFDKGTEMLVKDAVAAGSGNVRFVLATGFSTTLVNAIQPGDIMSIPIMSQYVPTSSFPAVYIDNYTGLWTIVSADSATGQIVATPPAAILAYHGLFDLREAYPIYVDRHHAFDWLLETNQWAPVGLRYLWKWYMYHLMMKVELLRSAASQNVTIGWRTNLSDQYGTRTTALSDNSNGFFQVLGQTIPTNFRHFGQAFQMKLSGEHLGGKILLQYLAIEIERQGLTESQIFEG